MYLRLNAHILPQVLTDLCWVLKNHKKIAAMVNTTHASMLRDSRA